MLFLLLFSVTFLDAISSVTITSTATYDGVVQSSTTQVWAVDLPSLQVKLTISDAGFPGTATINVRYLIGGTLTVSCPVDFSTSPCSKSMFGCIEPSGYSITCGGTSSSSPLTIDLSLPKLGSAFNNSKVEFRESSPTITDWADQDLTISLKECSSLPGATVTAPLPTPCGHDCSAVFECNPGYTGSDFSGVCSAVAEWTAVNTCVEICEITDECKNCVIAGGTAAIAVNEAKNATCNDTFSSLDDPQVLTCASGSAALVFNIQCNASCPASSTCKNCDIAGGLVLPTTIKSRESVTAQCIALSSSLDDPQIKTCYDGNEIVMDLNCGQDRGRQ